MNNKQFLKIFNDIDEEIIQQANEDVNAWLKDRSGVVLRSDGKRKFPWKTVIATAACTAAVASGVFIMNKFIPVNPLENPNDSAADTDSLYHFAYTDDWKSWAESDGWEIKHVKADYPVYRDVEELVSSADLVFIGKVHAFGGAVVNYENGLSEWLRSTFLENCPCGEIEVITPYKGLDAETDMIPFVFTMKDLYLNGQSQAVPSSDSDKTMVVYDMPEITIGETYLFALREDGTHSTREYGDTYTCLLNPYQSVMNISEPSAKDRYGYLSAKDIISYFGENKSSEFNADYPVFHSAKELVSDADVVFVGTVRNYGTATLNNHNFTPPPLGEQVISDIEETVDLYLCGEVEVITPYKGTISEAETIKITFTMKGLYSGEEIKGGSVTTRELMIETVSGEEITIVYDMPEIKIGETYLFCLKADGNTYNFTVNPYQSVMNISEPSAKDKYGYLSAEDIISYFGE